MRLHVRAASLCAAAILALVLVPAAYAQEPIGDLDGDGVADVVDNCSNIANPDQSNLDGDDLGDACDPDDDNDTRPDATDNCPTVPNLSQSDYDLDGIGNACDDVTTTEGFAGGGGLLNNAVVSFSFHSRGTKLTGNGRVIDGDVTVEVLDVTAFHSKDVAAWATGNASINGGPPTPYYFEVGDATNFTFFEVGAYRWAGPMRAGNIVVK